MKTALEAIEAYIHQVLETEPVPGIAFALTDRDSTLHVGAYGLAEMASQARLTTNHLMQIGSIGKSFTALALLQFYESGLLDLHAPVVTYLPWLEISSVFDPICIHHLLTHSAGIPMGTDESPSPEGEAWNLRRVETSCAPGEYFHYSNTGFKILGLVLEELAGRPYAQVIRERILEPLGMHATEPVITYANIPRHATGHYPFPPDRPIGLPYVGKRSLAATPWFETATGDGCISSTPGDMALYARALLSGFDSLISKETFALMSNRHIRMQEKPEMYYGYALDVAPEQTGLQIGHGGGMLGFFSFILTDMLAGTGAIVMLNGPGPTLQIVDFALAALRAERDGEPLPDLPSVRGQRRIEDPGSFTGKYRGPAGELEISERGGELVMLPADTVLVRQSGDIFHADHPDLDRFFFQFERDAEGTVTELVHGGDWYAGERYGGVGEFDIPDRWQAYTGHFAVQNPWFPAFRICLRKDRLVLIDAFFEEAVLEELQPGLFRIGEDARYPEQLRFDAFIAGKPYIAEFSGTAYYRMFSP